MNRSETDEINNEPVDEVIKKPETREEMLSRHRKETAQLQNKEIAMKKGAAKGSKAEQKAKKKQIEEEIAKLSDTLKQKQEEEIALLVPENTELTPKVEQWKPSKGAKRRSKKAQEEHAREERIKEEQNIMVSDKMVEDEKLERKLGPLGLSINEIKPDGHCLYRAVEDQLARLSGGSSPYTYTDLRQMVANYMRNNAGDFLPFMDNGEDGGDSIEERFSFYCNEVEFSSAWGGQMELGALSHCLKKHITVVSGSFPDVEMGKEYQLDGRILLSYHKHAFGLGEHYNSVVPNVIL